jgi:hypothetical protein
MVIPVESVLLHVIGSSAHIGVKGVVIMFHNSFAESSHHIRWLCQPSGSHISVKRNSTHYTFMASHVGLVVFLQDDSIWCGATPGGGCALPLRRGNLCRQNTLVATALHAVSTNPFSMSTDPRLLKSMLPPDMCDNMVSFVSNISDRGFLQVSSQ